MYYFYLFTCITYFQSLSLGVDDLENFQELVEQGFEQQAGNLGKWPLTILIIGSFSL
jgi:hypothetical protein